MKNGNWKLRIIIGRLCLNNSLRLKEIEIKRDKLKNLNLKAGLYIQVETHGEQVYD